jgi:hypothetical protein
MSSSGAGNTVRQLMRDLADRLVRPPSIELLSAAVPVGDDIVRIANENRIVREVEEASLIAQQHVSGLVLHGEESRGSDRREAHQAPDKSRVCGEAMRQQIAHHRQCHASQSYEQNSPPLQKVGGHQHNNDVENGNSNIERRHRVDNENRDCQCGRGHRKEG